MPPSVRVRATVEQVVDHAPGLRTLVLTPERVVPRFRPGQFLHLALDSWDPSRHWPESRPFSLASPPEWRTRLRVSVSEVGRFTSRMMATRAGDLVWLKLPYGEFIVDTDHSGPSVLVAGGTGVAPFVSLIASDEVLAAPVRLLYGVRRPELLIYRADLDAAAARDANFSWQPFVEEGDLAGARAGRLSVEAVLEAIDSTGMPATAVTYLSGPPEMIALLRANLENSGIESHRIRVDAWT